MNEIRQTEEFSKWLSKLNDKIAKAKILVRIDRLILGLTGDSKLVGEKVFELRINYGPGYRIYYTRKRKTIYILLYGGDKSSQKRDIKAAQRLAKEMMEN